MSRNSFGYTMVEVMLVLIILGMVAALAVPSINGTLDEMKIDGAAREVVSAIYYAQSLAIKEGKEYAVKFKLTDSSFKVNDHLSGMRVVNPLDKKPYEVIFEDEGPLQGVVIISADFNTADKIMFNYLGEPDNGGSVILAYGNFQKTINVTQPLGKVSVN